MIETTPTPVQRSLMHNIYVISDIDECAKPRDVCPYLTECINTMGSYICDCKEAGFKADGKQCLGKPSIGKMLKQQHILHVVIGPDSLYEHCFGSLNGPTDFFFIRAMVDRQESVIRRHLRYFELPIINQFPFPLGVR